jgi:RimJ/RimL family protein N-acetyltransferase
MPVLEPPDPPLTDGVVLLRPWREADIPRLTALSRDPEIYRFTRVPVDNTLARVRQYYIDHAPARTQGRYLALAICAVDDPSALGTIALQSLDWEHRRGEIGYWMGAPSRGRGLVTRAVGLLAGWGLERLGLARVGIMCASANVASQHVAERAGFAREGVLRGYQQLKGERQDMVVYSRLASDGPPGPAAGGIPPRR